MTKKQVKIEKDEETQEDLKEENIVSENLVEDNVVEDEVSVLKKQVQENLENWKRAQADFENYKKMQADSQKDLLKYATQNIILQIIPVLDNFQMSTGHIPEDQKDGGWVTGIMYIQKQLESVLTENGVTEIAPKVGDNFDPALHEAIEDKHCGCEHCDCEEEKPKFQNKIKTVMMKGYKIGDRVVRAARVVVE
ncbi:MAG: nucleotide exchange factor GrpE [Candidatus Moraniibacteriota bacterium]